MLHPLPNLNPSFQIANLEPGLTEIPPKLEIFEPKIGLLTSRTATPDELELLGSPTDSLRSRPKLRPVKTHGN